METSRFLNVSDAASYLGVSAASLRKWSDQGLVRVYRTPGGQRRYAPEDLDGFLAAMRQPVVPQAIPRYGRSADFGANTETSGEVSAQPVAATAQPARAQARDRARDEQPAPSGAEQRRRARRAA